MKRLTLLSLWFAALTSFAATPATDWAPNLTTTAAWVGNVSNGAAVWDRIATLQLRADALSSNQYQLTPNDTATATLHAGGEWFPRFKKLTSGALGGRLGWHHTFGTTEFSPIFSLEGAADAIVSWESARRGTAGSITLKLAKRFDTAWRAAVIQRFDRYEAKRSVFDAGRAETTVEVGRDLAESTRVVLAGIWREGDVVTYASYSRPDLVAIAHDSALLYTFGSEGMTAYATDARTFGGRFSIYHATAEDTAMVLAYEYSRTDRTGLKFANSVVSVSFVRQY